VLQYQNPNFFANSESTLFKKKKGIQRSVDGRVGWIRSAPSPDLPATQLQLSRLVVLGSKSRNGLTRGTLGRRSDLSAHDYTASPRCLWRRVSQKKKQKSACGSGGTSLKPEKKNKGESTGAHRRSIQTGRNKGESTGVRR